MTYFTTVCDISEKVLVRVKCSRNLSKNYLTFTDSQNLMDRKVDGCGPFFLAATRGCIPMAEYLLEQCDANVDDLGIYQDEKGNEDIGCSALWMVSQNGDINMLKWLIDKGADVNCMASNKFTPLMNACRHGNLPVILILLEHGASVDMVDLMGRTALILAVQRSDITQELLRAKAPIDAMDKKDMAAIHHAVLKNHPSTVRLLLQYGANPKLKTKSGMNVLTIACVKGCFYLFNCLLEWVNWTPKERRDALLFEGAVLFNEYHEYSKAMSAWRMAASIACTAEDAARAPNPIASPFSQQREIRTLADIEQLEGNTEKVRIQCIVICERVLGFKARELFHQLIFAGVNFADSQDYPNCVKVWNFAMSLIVYGKGRHDDTIYLGKAMVKLLLQILDSKSAQKREVPFEALLHTLDLFIACLSSLLSEKDSSEPPDFLMELILCILHFIVLSQPSGVEHEALKVSLNKLIQMNPKTLLGYNILMVAIKRDDVFLEQFYDAEREKLKIHCNPNIIHAILTAGFQVNDATANGTTALYLASCPENYDEAVLDLLLDFGAHVDQMSSSGKSALLNMEKIKRHDLMKYVSLKCCAARAVKRYNVPYTEQDMPKELIDVIENH